MAVCPLPAATIRPEFCFLDYSERHPASGFADRKLQPELPASGGWDSGARLSRDSHQGEHWKETETAAPLGLERQWVIGLAISFLCPRTTGLEMP